MRADWTNINNAIKQTSVERTQISMLDRHSKDNNRKGRVDMEMETMVHSKDTIPQGGYIPKYARKRKAAKIKKPFFQAPMKTNWKKKRREANLGRLYFNEQS